MKKALSTLLVSTILLGGASVAFAAEQTIVGENTGDIEVNGTLGIDNTDPDAEIPEGDDWINVTVPTQTIFYNTAGNSQIQAPDYSIVNNSGRPVKVNAIGFEAAASNPTAPTDFVLNLKVIGTSDNPAATSATPLVSAGNAITPINSHLITLANSKNQIDSTDAQAAPVKNKATFTFDGSATASSQIQLQYTLKLKFEAVSFN